MGCLRKRGGFSLALPGRGFLFYNYKRAITHKRLINRLEIKVTVQTAKKICRFFENISANHRWIIIFKPSGYLRLVDNGS